MGVTGESDDFFAHGGGSLSAAQLVTVLRGRFPLVTVADLYQHPRLGDLAAILDATVGSPDAGTNVEVRDIRPTPVPAQLLQLGVTLLVHTLRGLSWLTMLAASNNVLAWAGGVSWAPTISWWWVLAGFLLFITPLGRMATAVLGARLLLGGVRPGTYPRAGSVHLRLWTAERLAEAVGAANLAGAPWIVYYARALGAKVGRGVDLHTLPPITGMLTLGSECAIEPEVDLSGYWLDGDQLHLGMVRVHAGATIGSRTTLGPGAEIGRGARVEPGSFVAGTVPDGEAWAGAPAVHVGFAAPPWPDHRPARRPWWVAIYGVTSACFSGLPLLSAIPSLLLIGSRVHGQHRLGGAALAALAAVPLASICWLVLYALLTVGLVRLLGLGLHEGFVPVRSRVGWQAWATERLLDSARTLLFPLYSSLFTPVWLRLLGADIGRGVEASTVLLLPAMTHVGDGAFLADDTMVASYELGGGWIHLEAARVGKRAFLGNSGMAAPGRTVPKNGLVAVLSAAPEHAKKGTSWLGSPPVQLRRSNADADQSRTFSPPTRLRVARSLVELCRIVPTALSGAIAVGVALSLEWLIDRSGYAGAALAGGVVLLVAGAVAGSVHDGGEVAARRPNPRRRVPAVELVRVAQRGRRHVRRDGRRAVVRERRLWDLRPDPVAALARRPHRPRRVVRDVLAARGGSRRARRRSLGQPGLRAADAPLP